MPHRSFAIAWFVASVMLKTAASHVVAIDTENHLQSYGRRQQSQGRRRVGGRSRAAQSLGEELSNDLGGGLERNRLVDPSTRLSLTASPTASDMVMPQSSPSALPSHISTPSPVTSPNPTRFPTKSPVSPRPTHGPTPRPSNPPTTTSPITDPPSTTSPVQSSSSVIRNVPVRTEICPRGRESTEKYLIEEYTDLDRSDRVDDDLAEISSMVFSGQTDRDGHTYAYAVSDREQFSLKVIRFQRGDTARQTATVATYKLNVAYDNDDWEDLSLGPCSSDPSPDTPICIYVGNFGNNPRNNYNVRRELEIFKFPEPDFEGETPKSQTIDVATIVYRYENDRDLDAEAMFVDWTGSNSEGTGKADIYIVTKGSCSNGEIGRIPASRHEDLQPRQVTNVGQLETVLNNPPKQGTDTCSDSGYQAFQGADMSRDGKLIALIARQRPAVVYFYARGSGQSVRNALEDISCKYNSESPFDSVDEYKYEVVAFVDDLHRRLRS